LYVRQRQVGAPQEPPKVPGVPRGADQTQRAQQEAGPHAGAHRRANCCHVAAQRAA